MPKKTVIAGVPHSRTPILSDELDERRQLAEYAFKRSGRVLAAWKTAAHALKSWPTRDPLELRRLARKRIGFRLGTPPASKPEPSSAPPPASPRRRLAHKAAASPPLLANHDPAAKLVGLELRITDRPDAPRIAAPAPGLGLDVVNLGELLVAAGLEAVDLVELLIVDYPRGHVEARLAGGVRLELVLPAAREPRR